MNRNSTQVAIGTLLVALLMFLGGCDDSSGSSGGGVVATALLGTVENPAGIEVVGATVYLVPADQIDMTPITAAGVLAGTTEGFDEPLEDLIAAAGAGFSQAVTDATGGYVIDPVPDGRFFLFASPDAADTEHLPGGSLCRVSYKAEELRGVTLDITMTSSPPASATFVGMSNCLTCHPQHATEKTLAHRLGFRVPGVSSPLQDTSEHPEIDEGLELFLDGTVFTEGTPVYFYDYDFDKSGFDKFKTSLTDPGANVSAILWVWHDTVDDAYKITIDNVGNPAVDRQELEVKLTYGGAVYKQRYMVEWPGLNGLYPILQYQTFGSDGIYDRSRKQFRDYHLDFYWDNNNKSPTITDDLIATPSITKTITRNCMGCHATDYSQFTDPVTMEVLCDTLEDPAGEYDIDGDGFLNDLNTGCESCHGPGSQHIANMGNEAPRWILNPEYLSQSRQVMVCGRCHDRQIGNGTVKNDHPLNAADEFPEPGTSRADYLASYVTRSGPAPSSFWTDFEHSKSHHQQAPDMLKSSHYRNPYQLVVCWDCHNMHGGTGFPHGLVEDPDAPDTPLCMNCHGDHMPGTTEHTLEHLGVAHGSFSAKCVDCHMTKTAKTGSGEYGALLGPPTGTSADDDITYFENDVTSHVFDVISKGNVGVKGVQPVKAMPAPYVNACGTCHDPSNLQF